MFWLPENKLFFPRCIEQVVINNQYPCVKHRADNVTGPRARLLPANRLNRRSRAPETDVSMTALLDHFH